MLQRLCVIILCSLCYESLGWRGGGLHKSVFPGNWCGSMNALHFKKGFRKRWTAAAPSYSDGNLDIIDGLDYKLYDGPVSDFGAMGQGFTVQESGLILTTGPSKQAVGRGLFLAVSNQGDVLLLEKGTILCGYARGLLQQTASGDKSVDFSFADLHTTVLYNKQLLPLLDAVNEAVDMHPDLDMKHIVYGHLLECSRSSGEVVGIETDQSCAARAFVPDEMPLDQIDVKNIGLYANDLAFNQHITSAVQYQHESAAKNILSLVWRLELVDGQLRPSWPVVVFKKDTYIGNHVPMEVGIEYSWRYWLAALRT